MSAEIHRPRRGRDRHTDFVGRRPYKAPKVYAVTEHDARRLLPRRHERAATKQLYLPDNGVLITRFLSPDGVSEIQDFMPVHGGPRRLIRRLVRVRGNAQFVPASLSAPSPTSRSNPATSQPTRPSHRGISAKSRSVR